MSGAGVLGLFATVFILEAIALGIASLGLALHWSCLIVALALGVIAAAFYFRGRSLAHEPLVPNRTVSQIATDAQMAKEQLT